MKSQDILLLLKFVCIEQQEKEFSKQQEYSEFIEENPETIIVEPTDEFLEQHNSGYYDTEEIPESETLSTWDDLESNSFIARNQLENWEGWRNNKEETEELYPEPKSLKIIQNQYKVRELERLTGISKTEVSNSLKRNVSSGLVYLEHESNYPRVNKLILFNLIIHAVRYVFPASVSVMARGIPTSFAAPALKEHIETAGDLIYVWPDPYGKQMGQSVSPLYPSVPVAVRRDRQLYEFMALIDAIRLGNARESKIARERLEKGLVKT